MVMKPEPWGEAFDTLLGQGDHEGVVPTIIFTTPSGEPFTQQVARELSAEQHLVFACGRYEGIDQRVIDHAASSGRVREISLGDYVLNGGEVAALAVTEAVVRLLPGFMGNPESLTEESHEDGLLEYPVYTKPATWRGHDVPAVLMSGNHRAVADWRHEQRVRRTALRRPDLVHRSVLDDDTVLRAMEPADVGELLTLQRACWSTELLANPGVEVPALTEGLDDVAAWPREHRVLVAHRGSRLVAAARGRMVDDVWEISRLMAAPDLQGQGLGWWMLEQVEALAPAELIGFTLLTGAGSPGNLARYRKAGYRRFGDPVGGLVRLTKRRR